MASPLGNFVFSWRNGTHRWQIFGLRPDHGFYGEYIDLGSREGFRRLEGTVSPDDYERVASLVEQIKALPPRTECEAPDRVDSGLLSEGSRAEPDILFRRFENEPAPVHDKLFADLVSVMTKYV